MRENRLNAAEVLHALDELGAINLDVLIGSAEKVRDVLSSAGIDDPDQGICYPFVMHVGPPVVVDLVTVAADVKNLGFEINRIAH